MLQFWLSSVNQNRCCLSSPVTRRANGLFIDMRRASPVSWVSLAHASFLEIFSLCLRLVADLFATLRLRAEDRVEMVIKVHCGTVVEDAFSTLRQIRPPEQSHNALWQPSRPGLPRNLKVANKSRLSRFATLKTRRKLGRGSFRKDFWDRYWGRAIQLLANFFALSP